MSLLSQHRTAILATDGFEELELIEPMRALREQGAHVDLIAPHEGPIQAMHHHHKTIRVHVDRVLSEMVLPDQYDSLVLPGGAINATALRNHPLVHRFVNEMNAAEKPIAAICHAGWILISAGIVTNRKVTSPSSLRDDLLNSGAFWADQPVVVQDNLLTARSAKDLAAFDVAMVELFARKPALISPETRHLFARSRIA